MGLWAGPSALAATYSNTGVVTINTSTLDSGQAIVPATPYILLVAPGSQSVLLLSDAGQPGATCQVISDQSPAVHLDGSRSWFGSIRLRS